MCVRGVKIARVRDGVTETLQDTVRAHVAGANFHDKPRCAALPADGAEDLRQANPENGGHHTAPPRSGSIRWKCGVPCSRPNTLTLMKPMGRCSRVMVKQEQDLTGTRPHLLEALPRVAPRAQLGRVDPEVGQVGSAVSRDSWHQERQ
jgi:hypothetical protein